MASVAVMIPESPLNGVDGTPSCCSPSRPRTGRRITRDSLLWMRPARNEDGWGLSAQKVSLTDCIDAQGAEVSTRSLDEEIASREEFLLGSLFKESDIMDVKFDTVSLKKDDEGDSVSGDEGSTAGGSSSDGYRESSDEDPLSPSADSLTLLSPAVCSSNSSSPMKSAAPRISLVAALYNATSSPLAHSTADESMPPAPWWWPSPQFDAPEVKDSPPEKEAEDVPKYDAPPGLSTPPGLDNKESPRDHQVPPAIGAPPGLEKTFEVPMSDIPQGVSTPPSFDANLIVLAASTNPSDSDMVPPPPSWSADTPLPPTWWPTSPTAAALDATPPPPSWSADDEASSDTKEEGSDAESELSLPPSPSCPPPPADTKVSDSTPPPPSYDAPGFEASSASLATSSCLDSIPQNVAAPPSEPPKLVLSLENLSVAKAPPSEAPKDLPKLQVSLDELTSSSKAAQTPFMAPPAYMAPGFAPQYFNGMMSPAFSPCFSPMTGGYPSAMGAPPTWGQF